MLRTAINLKQLRLTQFSRFQSVKRFTAEHEWISVDSNNVGTVGITDYAQKALGDVVFVEVPPVGKQLNQREVLGAVESVKAASDIYSPISGKVVESNTELDSNPSLINSDPEGEGWLAKIKIENKTQLDQLMDSKAYKEHCEKADNH